MKPLNRLCLLLVLLPLLSGAQSAYQINGVRVIQHGDTLRNAWCGGFNNPVFSSIDLNQDGLADLFVYDKAGWKALSFINTGSPGHPSFIYAPEYDRMYPRGLQDWAVIRDYNKDGIGDIFADTTGGGIESIRAYRGYRSGNTLSYVLSYPTLRYPIGSDLTNMWSFADNMPVIMDMNGDGAIDILAPDLNQVTLDYYRNVAPDSGYLPDSLVFVGQSYCWGHVAEDFTDCNVTLDTCSPDHIVRQGDVRDLRHDGGACNGFLYNRYSDIPSIFVADIYCNTTKFLWNQGSIDDADITFVDTTFPSYDLPIDIPLFPAVYTVDMDNDGFDDLLVAPFASNAYTPSQSEDINVVRYYHNNAGTDSFNTFHYENDTVFNNSMVDAGTQSHPVFFDYNGDGLMDIVIGNYGHYTGPGNPQLSTPGTAMSSLYLYENIGSSAMPVYTLVDTDWNHLSALDSNGAYNGLFPAFGDLDGDGLPDMVIGDQAGNINFFHNSGTVSGASYPSFVPDWYGIQVADDAAPFIYDVNGDGLPDLVIGSGGVNVCGTCSDIYYYWNFGTRTHPQFSPDSVNDFFGHIVLWPQNLGVEEAFPTPFITKENGDMVLYTGAFDGHIYKYAVNPDSLRSGSFVQISSDVLGVSPGRFSSVSVADINGDGRNDYLTGNIRGGIMLFSDVAWSSSSTNAIANIPAAGDQFEVFPNPAKDVVFCRISSTADVLVSARLYDLLGEPVEAALSRQADNTIQLTVAGIANGIYIIEARDQQGRMFQNKISIFK